MVIYPIHSPITIILSPYDSFLKSGHPKSVKTIVYLSIDTYFGGPLLFRNPPKNVLGIGFSRSTQLQLMSWRPGTISLLMSSSRRMTTVVLQTQVSCDGLIIQKWRWNQSENQKFTSKKEDLTVMKVEFDQPTSTQSSQTWKFTSQWGFISGIFTIQPQLIRSPEEWIEWMWTCPYLTHNLYG